MNDIKFNLEDTENIDFSVDYAVKEVYPPLENLEVIPSVEEQVFNHENSYGYDEVKVKAIEDENLVPENIKQGVNILGVEGTMVGGKYAPRFVSFYNCQSTELDYEISNLDTSNITDMYQMFGYCGELTSLDLSNFNTSNVTDMGKMFNSCLELTSLDLSSFNTSLVTKMNYMFSSCSKLTFLDIRNFTFDKVTSYSGIFDSVPADCEIIVKGQTEKEWVLARRNTLTNVKTIAEYENGI